MDPTESQPDSFQGTSTADLFAAWSQRRDTAARAELIRRHLPLARRLASRYVRPTESIEDLAQVAAIGLINAVERFDPSRGVAFSSFAVPTILGEIKRHFRDTSWAVRVDRRTQERATALAAARREITESGREPTVANLAAHMECTNEDVLDALEASTARSAVSLDAPAGTESDAGSLADTVGGTDLALESVAARADIESAVRHLPHLERRILHLRFSEDLSQREIADQVGISQMHVSRLLRRALGELRALVDDKIQPAPEDPLGAPAAGFRS